MKVLSKKMTRIVRFRDRRQAGQLLAKELSKYMKYQDLLILALPRGGVPVGFEVAKALSAPLDIYRTTVFDEGVPHRRLPTQKCSASNARTFLLSWKRPAGKSKVLMARRSFWV